jgi:hypothetical protein
MKIDFIDDFVWEHYETLTGYDGFDGWRDSVPWYGWAVSVNSIHAHAEQKWEEHKMKYAKLVTFRDSLDPHLQNCVNPFMRQQDKLRQAYFTIWLGTFCH